VKRANIKFLSKQSTYGTGTLGSFMLAKASSQKGKDTKIVQSSGPTTCREALISAVYNGLRNKTINMYGTGGASLGAGCLDRRKTRVIHITKNTTKATDKTKKTLISNAERAVKLIRHFEKLAGWKQRTEVFSVEWKEKKTIIAKPKQPGQPVVRKNYSVVQCFLYVGSKQWQENPQLLSLFALLIRLGRFAKLSPFKSHKQLVENVNGLAKTNGTSDLKHFAKFMEFSVPMMKNLKEIFGAGGVRQFNSNSRGIMDFLTGRVGSKKALNVLMSIKEGKK